MLQFGRTSRQRPHCGLFVACGSSAGERPPRTSCVPSSDILRASECVHERRQNQLYRLASAPRDAVEGTPINHDAQFGGLEPDPPCDGLLLHGSSRFEVDDQKLGGSEFSLARMHLSSENLFLLLLRCFSRFLCLPLVCAVSVLHVLFLVAQVVQLVKEYTHWVQSVVTSCLCLVFDSSTVVAELGSRTVSGGGTAT